MQNPESRNEDEDILNRYRALLSYLPAKHYGLADGSLPAEKGACHPNRARLFIIIKGKRRMRFANRGQTIEKEFNEGDFLFCSTNAWHQIAMSECSLFSLIFDPAGTLLTWKSDIDRDFNLNWAFMKPNGLAINGCLQAINHSLSNQKNILNPLISALLHLMVEEIKNQMDSHSKSFTLFQAIRYYLNENYYSKLSRESVANNFKMHPNHLSRIFKEFSDTTFSKCLNELRLEKSIGLLKDNNEVYSIKEISEQCGFDNSNYFCKVFKKKYGLSPGKMKGK